MMRYAGQRQRLAWFLAVSLLVGFALYFFATDEKKVKHARRAQTAGRAELVRSSSDQKLQKFNLTGFDDHGKKFWNLQGDTAKIDAGQTVYLDQNVTLKLKDNTSVRTDHVQWSQDGGSLQTDSLVYVDHENAKIEGRGAVGRPNDGFIQLNHTIHMVINQSDKITTLTCDGPMKVYYKENKMIFFRHVKVEDERGVLTSNRMDVYFDADEKKVNKIVAVGSVVIERGKDTTHSRRAIYNLTTGSVRLEGNPEITLHKGGAGILDGPIGN